MPSEDSTKIISKLADGTLDPARRDEARAQIESSPALRALYERERRMVERLREARATDRAPAALRERIEAARPSAAARPTAAARRRARLGYAAAATGALAAVVLALVLLLPGGAPGAPSVSQAAGLAGRGVAAPAPVPDPDAPAVRLDRQIEHLYFPNWAAQFGWRAVGQRSDRIGRRPAVTVYYAWRGQRIAYTIVGAPALTPPVAQVTWSNRTELRTLTIDGRVVVTWQRAGRTCILSGTDVDAHALQRLASWEPPVSAS